METECHNIASRIFLKGISKGPLGAGLASMDIGIADRLAVQNLQIPEHSTNTTLPNCSNENNAKGLYPVSGVRSRGGYAGNREHSAPVTATPPSFKVRHPSQLLPEQRYIYFVEAEEALPTSIKEEEKHCLKRAVNLPHHQAETKRASGNLEGCLRHVAPASGCEEPSVLTIFDPNQMSVPLVCSQLVGLSNASNCAGPV
eukprot:1136639-Pelagomonas_calceolata.AAC.1